MRQKGIWKAEICQPVTGFPNSLEGGTKGTCCCSGRRVMDTGIPTPRFNVLSINGTSGQTGSSCKGNDCGARQSPGQGESKVASQCGHSGAAICVPSNHLQMPGYRAGMHVLGRKGNTTRQPPLGQIRLQRPRVEVSYSTLFAC